MRAIASAITLLALASSCSKDAPNADEPKAPTGPAAMAAAGDPSGPPADLIAVIAMPDGLRLTELVQAAATIEPNVQAMMPMLTGNIDTIFKEQFKTLNSNEAMYLLVMNPKIHDKPLLAVGSFASEPKDIGFFPNGALSVAGDDKAVDAVVGYARHLKAPSRLSATVFLPQLRAAYEKEIAESPKTLGKLGGGQGAMLTQMTEMYVMGFKIVAEQANRVEFVLDRGDRRATLSARIHANPGSTFAGYIAAQTPHDFSLLAQHGLPPRAITFDGVLTAGPAKQTFLDFFSAKWFSSTLPAKNRDAYVKFLNQSMDHLTGGFAGSVNVDTKKSGSPAARGAVAVALTGQGGFKAIVDGLYSSWTGGPHAVMGMKQSHRYTAEAGKVAGVTFAKHRSRVEIPGAKTTETETYLAIPDPTRAVMLFGGDDKARKADLAEVIAKSKGGWPEAASTEVGLARKRGASALFLFDLTALLPGGSIPVSGVGVTVDHDDSVMTWDFDLLK